MKTRISRFALALCSLLLATTGIASRLHAQVGNTNKPPLSFYNLASGQSIKFRVSGMMPHFSASPITFRVEVSNKPRPVAKIQLEENASMSLAEAGKAVGNHVDEIRPLTQADLQALQTYLLAYRATGELDLEASRAVAATTSFELITLRKTNDTLQADTDKRELYRRLRSLDEDFVKNFVGFIEK